MFNKIIKTKNRTVIRDYIDEFKFFILIKKYLNDLNKYNSNKLIFVKGCLIILNNVDKMMPDLCVNGTEYVNITQEIYVYNKENKNKIYILKFSLRAKYKNEPPNIFHITVDLLNLLENQMINKNNTILKENLADLKCGLIDYSILYTQMKKIKLPYTD